MCIRNKAWVHLGTQPLPARATAAAFTHREALSVAPVLQLVVAGVESEGLHDVGARPQELTMQLAHCNAKRTASARDNCARNVGL